MKPVYELLLWDNCKNKCKFCFQRDNPRIFNLKVREKILDDSIKFVDSDIYVSGSHLLIVGGEIFDTSVNFPILSKFFDKIIDRMLSNRIDLLYINTNLIYKDLRGLIDFLNKIQDNNLFDRLKFTTSYDFYGRFKDSDSEKLMLNNLKYIKETYKDIRVVTNIILTKQACEAIINNPAVLLCIPTQLNLIPYIIHDIEMVAKRSIIFRALLKANTVIPGYLDNYINNLDNGQDKLLYVYKNNKFEYCSCELAECGHAVNFKRYSEEGTCFICDLKEMLYDRH